jgi:drug/metabolite transporter (DMT)-like permease
MHLSIILWGATGVLGKSIHLSEGLLVWYRLVITTATLGVHIWFLKGSFRVSKKNFLRLSGIGALLMVHWLLFYGAIKYSNVSVTLSLFSSTTLFTALIEPLTNRKKFKWDELLYSAVAISGIAIIFYTDTNRYTTGIILALLAAFIGAFFNVLNKKIVHEISSDVVSFYEIFSGLGVLTLLLPVYISFFKPVQLFPDAYDWLLLVVLALVCTHVTLILSLNALRHLSAFTLNLSINLEPVYGIALAFLIYGENRSMNSGFFIGTIIILTSVALHSWFAVKEKPKMFRVNKKTHPFRDRVN